LEEDPLPEGWEEMKDPSSGRPFYIDHASKRTTWDRPKNNSSKKNINNSSNSNGVAGVATGFGFSPTPRNNSNGISSSTKSNSANTHYGGKHSRNSDSRSNHGDMNKYGSHSHWDEDPRSGSRYSRSRSHDGDRDYAMGLLRGQENSSHPGPPPLDFSAVSVPDALRPSCPGCWQVFSMTRRRHHCRLCGDVFCDACSSSRTVLPLDGPEYAVPVRVCDCCMKDVNKGNYFSLRRYLTPLQLYDPDAPPSSSGKKKAVDDGAGSGEKTKEITIHTVAASLSSLSVDVESMVLDPTSFQEKITIPASILVPAIGRHLKQRLTAEYAIRVLASLLMLGNVVGDESFALAIYEERGGLNDSESMNSATSADEEGRNRTSTLERMKAGEMVNDILAILEWSGSDSRTLSALEQATKVVFYITEPNFIASAISNLDSHRNGGEDGQNSDGPVDMDALANDEMDLLQIDIHRAFRSMLDHATTSASPSLQRWATASLRHLITEDQRRACVFSSGPSRYISFTSQLVSSGGVMILCSLLGADDADIRAHATSALEAIVIATREIGMAVNKSPGKKGFYRAGRGTKDDSAIVDAIVSNGGCGNTLVHLLISADESVAMMGCAFASALISPLLTDPRGSGRTLQFCSSSAASGMGLDSKDDGLASYRNAALVLVVGSGSDDVAIRSDASCLPALIQILKSGLGQSWGGHSTRSMKLQVMAGECLAAISLAVGHIVCETAVNASHSMYGPLRRKAVRALEVMEQEQIYDVAFRIVTSASSSSLDASRNTPQSRLREAAGLIILACASCSSECASYLISNRAVSELVAIAGESRMLTSSSALRGDWASRGLCFLEASTTLLLQAWKNTRRDDDTSSTSPLSLLLEALDAGAVGIASRVVKWKVELHNHDKAYSNIRVKTAVCFMLSAMFGIARDDDQNAVGTSRLYNAIDADCAAALAYENHGKGRSDLIASTIALLKATAPYAQRFANGNLTTGTSDDEPLPMMDLSEACFLAVGSICGAITGCFASGTIGSSTSCNDLHMVLKSSDFGALKSDKHSHLRRDASVMACEILTMRTDQGPFLPNVLIGTIGESCIVPALRLTLAVVQNGHEELRGEVVRSGMLIPLGDILQNALSSGDRYTFSAALAIFRFCGPYATVGLVDSGSFASLKNAIRTMSCVLAISENANDPNEKRTNILNSLKLESLETMEALSSNDSLQSSISNDALPALAELLNSEKEEVVCFALKTIQKLISIPSSAAAVANTGIVASLIQLLQGNIAENVQEVAFDVLHTVALSKSGDLNIIVRLLSCGTVEAIATLLGSATASLHVTEIGLDILLLVMTLSDPSVTSSLHPSAKEGMLQQLRDAFVGQDQFVRALAATMLGAEKTRIVDNTLIPLSDNGNRYPFSPLYGHPLPVNETRSVGAVGHQYKAIQILFKLSSLMCCETREHHKEDFTNAFLLKEIRGSSPISAIACCTFLDVLNDEKNGICVPTNVVDKELYFEEHLPLVRVFLLEGLSACLDESLSSDETKDMAEVIISTFRIPQLCLVFCQSHTLAPEAFDLLQNVVLPLPIETLGNMLLEDKSTLIALFGLVTGKNGHESNREYVNQKMALLLGNLAKAGLLPNAIERLDLRKHAIAALSAAILINGNEDSTIDDDEESLPRICIESLATILSNENDEIEMSELESRTMADAIGKSLSTTVLNRFFVQANLETTMESIDHSIDRAAISTSAEAKLLCSLAESPESLIILGNVGGLEAISLIAHEGIITAIRAIRKACEISPKSIIDVDAHLSIMDALIKIRHQQTVDSSRLAELREVAIHCIHTITVLVESDGTRSAIVEAEQSLECLNAAADIISACASFHCTVSTTEASDPVESQKEYAASGNGINVKSEGSPVMQSKKCSDEKAKVEEPEGDPITEVEIDDEAGVETTNGYTEKEKFETAPQETPWQEMLSKDDFSLEKTVFSLLRAFGRIQPHRDAMTKNEILILALKNLSQIDELPQIRLQTEALDLLATLSLFVGRSCQGSLSQGSLADLFSTVVESRTRALQITRDRHEQQALKNLLQLSVLGLHSSFCSLNADSKAKSMRVASDLFVYMADSLFKGSKSRRSMAQKADGVLFCNLATFFILSIGNDASRNLIITRRFLSSLIRFVLMTAGLSTVDCHIPTASSEGSEYWASALAHCLFCLSCTMNETSQEELGVSFKALIEGVQFAMKPNSFMLCMRYLSENNLAGSTAISARQIMSTLDHLSC